MAITIEHDSHEHETPPVVERVLSLRRLQEAFLELRIVGRTPVIPHRWSEKSLQQMRDKQFGSSVQSARAPKNPQEEAEQSCYWLPDGRPGMPSTAFKAAIVGAVRFFQGISMVECKQALYVEGEGPEQLIAIEGQPEMFEATPRNSGGTVDLRYRMRIFPWAARLGIFFVPSKIDASSVVALLDAAGRGGVGDWRPSAPKSATGVSGTWRVEES